MNPPERRTPIKPITRGDRTVHFGCGAIVGLLAGFASMSLSGSPAAAAVSALIFGVLAAIFGDRFWHWIARWGTW